MCASACVCVRERERARGLAGGERVVRAIITSEQRIPE